MFFRTPGRNQPLPASQELQTPDSFYLKAKDVPREGPARIILGSYGSSQSPIPSTNGGINYLDVRMKKGEQWIYNVPSNHTVAFISVWKGKIKVFDDIVKADELVVFEESAGGNLNFASDDDACFILGTAEKHPHDLVLGSYSVHTCKESLMKGEANIKNVGAAMKAKGI